MAESTGSTLTRSHRTVVSRRLEMSIPKRAPALTDGRASTFGMTAHWARQIWVPLCANQPGHEKLCLNTARCAILFATVMPCPSRAKDLAQGRLVT